LQNIANDIEKDLKNTMEQEIESRRIGEMVMNRLKEMDEVAYVRFASVYRQFKDIDSYIEEIKKLKNQSNDLRRKCQCSENTSRILRNLSERDIFITCKNYRIRTY
jgi:predicted phage-related endonuclease